MAGQIVLHVGDVGEERPPHTRSLMRFWETYAPAVSRDACAPDQDFFVIRPVENLDTSAFRQAGGVTPQEIVFELGGCWLLKREGLAALRAGTRHHMLNCRVPGSVHSLKQHQQRSVLLSVENVLLLREPLDGLGPKRTNLTPVHLQTARVSWVEALQPKVRTVRNAKWPWVRHGFGMAAEGGVCRSVRRIKRHQDPVAALPKISNGHVRENGVGGLLWSKHIGRTVDYGNLVNERTR